MTVTVSSSSPLPLLEMDPSLDLECDREVVGIVSKADDDDETKDEERRKTEVEIERAAKVNIAQNMYTRANVILSHRAIE